MLGVSVIHSDLQFQDFKFPVQSPCFFFQSPMGIYDFVAWFDVLLQHCVDLEIDVKVLLIML